MLESQDLSQDFDAEGIGKSNQEEPAAPSSVVRTH